MRRGDGLIGICVLAGIAKAAGLSGSGNLVVGMNVEENQN